MLCVHFLIQCSWQPYQDSDFTDVRTEALRWGSLARVNNACGQHGVVPTSSQNDLGWSPPNFVRDPLFWGCTGGVLNVGPQNAAPEISGSFHASCLGNCRPLSSPAHVTFWELDPVSRVAVLEGSLEAALDLNLVFVLRDVIDLVVRVMAVSTRMPLLGRVFFINFHLVWML